MNANKRIDLDVIRLYRGVEADPAVETITKRPIHVVLTEAGKSHLCQRVITVLPDDFLVFGVATPGRRRRRRRRHGQRFTS